MGFYFFAVIALTVYTLVHYVVWRTVVVEPALPPVARKLSAVLFVFFATQPLQRMFLLPQSLARPSFVLHWFWVGLLLLTFMGVLLGQLGISILERLNHLPAHDPQRRAFFYRMVASGSALWAGGAGSFGATQAFGAFVLEHLRIVLPQLPAEHSGYKIAQISDVHIGVTLRRDFLERIVSEVNAQNPSLIVITGDLVDGSVENLASEVTPLRELHARDGVFFVTGNHERYSNYREWCTYLRSIGIRVLENERVRLGGFDLAGVHDLEIVGGMSGAERALQQTLRDRDRSVPVVLLAHQPKVVRHAAALGVDLQLSGHTHGGQFPPWRWLVGFLEPYVRGLHRVGNTQLYVHRGTGFFGPPLRIGAAPEIAVIELVRA